MRQVRRLVIRYIAMSWSALSYKKDVLASVVVFLVSLPLCMGIAIAAGLPASAGILSGVIGGLVVGMLTSVPLQVSGPAAGLILVVSQAIPQLGIAGLGLAVVLAGGVQILMGLLGLAVWFRAISPAVIQGGLSGLGLLIAAGQFHVMLDLAPSASGLENLAAIPASLMITLSSLRGHLSTSHHLAALVGLVTIAVAIGWSALPRNRRILPAPLMALAAGVLVAAIGGFNIRTIALPANLLDGLQLPDVFVWQQLLGSAALWNVVIGIAFVSVIETVLTMFALENRKPDLLPDYDRELQAQGIGNITAGLLGLFPVAGVIIRSAANIDAGATSRASTMLHGVWMLVAVLLLPGLLKLVPVSALAALLVFTGLRLMNLNSLKLIARHGQLEVVIFFVTFLTTIGLGLMRGVLVGVVLTFLKLVYQHTHLIIREEVEPDTHHIYLEGSASFLRLPRLIKALTAIDPNSGQQVILHVHGLQHLDATSIEYLMTWENRFVKAGGKLIVARDAQRAHLFQPIQAQD